MARRLLFKEIDDLGTPPVGYSVLGFDQDGNVKRVDETGTISNVNYVEPPRYYYLSDRYVTNQDGYHPFLWSLTGKDGFANLRHRYLDIDLSDGNFIGVVIDENVKSLKLPVKHSNNLSHLVLSNSVDSIDPVEVNLSLYPNMDRLLITEYWSSPSGKIRPNYLITGTCIDFSRSGAIWLGNNDSSTSTNFETSSLEVKPYHYQWVNIAAKSLTDVNINYSSIVGNYENEYEKISYNSVVNISNCPNLENVSLTGLNFDNLSPKSQFSLSFYSNDLTQSMIDSILETVDNYFTQSFININYLVLGNVDGSYEFQPSGDSAGNLGSGYTGLVVGQKYVIDEVLSGDDFSNVGYVTPGVEFTATNTDPTNWTNYTRVFFGSSFGTMKDISFVTASFAIPDGEYYFSIGESNCTFGMTFSNGNLVSKQLLQHRERGTNLDYVGRQFQMTADYLVLYNLDGYATWQGKDIDTVTFEVTDIYRNSAPTGGTSNTAYQSLVSKNWEVSIAKS